MENKNLSISKIQEVADYYENNFKTEQRTEYVRFDNNTHDFSVEVFLYEVRQKRDLPPPSGFSEWTGVTVGATNIDRGESRVAYLQQKVLGDFADAGCLNLKHIPTGRVTRTFNFTDRVAPAGRYFRAVNFGITQNNFVDKKVEVTIEFAGYLDDGNVIREFYTFLPDLI